MTNISKYAAGNRKLTIRISGQDKREVLEWAWFFENFGAVHFPVEQEIEQEIEELITGEYQLSFTVPERKVISAFETSTLFRLSDKPEYKGQKNGALPDARDEALWRLYNLPVFTPTRYDSMVAEFSVRKMHGTHELSESGNANAR